MTRPVKFKTSGFLLGGQVEEVFEIDHTSFALPPVNIPATQLRVVTYDRCPDKFRLTASDQRRTTDTMITPGYTYQAQVTRIHDGDTFTCDVDLGMRVWLRDQTVRLARVNAPELGRPDSAGEKSLAAVQSWLADSSMSVIIQTHKDEVEKWRRWLGEVFAVNKSGQSGQQYSVNQRLLDEHLAVPMP